MEGEEQRHNSKDDDWGHDVSIACTYLPQYSSNWELRTRHTDDPEADPLLSPRFPGRVDGPIGLLESGTKVSKTSEEYSKFKNGIRLPLGDILVDAHGLRFDVDDRLVLLFDQHGHFIEHLRQFSEGPFDLLDLGVSFLHFSVCSSSGPISVRVE